MKAPIVFLDGPDKVKFIGPLMIEYHHYSGPHFWWRRLNGRTLPLRAGRFSPLWLVWALVRRGMERQNGIVDDGELGASRDD